MHVIEVIPLARATQAESLSYYSAEPYEIGTILSVPLRNKDIQAVVVDIQPVSRAKTALKAATFSLRKITPPESITKLPQHFIATAKKLSQTYPASPGAILYTLLPPDIRNGKRVYPTLPEEPGNNDPTPAVFTGARNERYLVYKSYIRAAFAHRGSVVFVVPNSASVARAKKELESGIEKRVITFSSVQTKKQLDQAYESFCDLSKAKLIITTPNYALLDRHDITHIIVDKCGSNHHVSRVRPYLDAREVLKAYAKVTKRSILLGDILPLTTDEYRRREEFYHTHDAHPKRLSFPSSFTIAEHETKENETEFRIFTTTLTDTMSLALRSKGRVFLFAARKGLAPLVACYDCGYIFRCLDSGAPYSLWRKIKPDGEEERWFICSTSGKKVRAADVCPHCGSWRLREQGVGIQKVEDQVKELFPNTPMFRFDHETARTHQKAKKIIKEFYETKGSILIGTQMALPYLDKQIDVTAVMSYEAMRAIPSWRAEEMTLATLLQLRERTSKDCVVQTRSEPDGLLKIAKQGLIDQFYSEEIEVRESLKYPPFATFILLSYSGTKEQVNELEMQVEQQLVGYQLQSYNSPVIVPEKITRHTLVRVLRSKWPDEHLVSSLRSLPPNIRIELDPERIV